MFVVGTPQCKLCEKMVITIESHKFLETLLELPNTFDAVNRQYVWKRDNDLSYVLIPQSIAGRTGVVDLYLCVDEDILDDIDVRGYAIKFLREEVFPHWQNFKDAHISEPMLSTPDVVGCWKLQRTGIGEND